MVKKWWKRQIHQFNVTKVNTSYLDQEQCHLILPLFRDRPPPEQQLDGSREVSQLRGTHRRRVSFNLKIAGLHHYRNSIKMISRSGVRHLLMCSYTKTFRRHLHIKPGLRTPQDLSLGWKWIWLFIMHVMAKLPRCSTKEIVWNDAI